MENDTIAKATHEAVGIAYEAAFAYLLESGWDVEFTVKVEVSVVGHTSKVEGVNP